MSQHFDPQVSRTITRIQAIPKLSREEEGVLVRAWIHQRDAEARDRLVQAHLRYVVSVALSHRRYGVSVGELIAEGTLGTLHALDKFDPERGTRFVTYAVYWIRAFVLNHILRSWSLVGVGSGALRSKMFFKLRRERARIANLIGDSERAEEALAEAVGVPRAKVVSMIGRLDARDVSIDMPASPTSTTTLADSLIAPDMSQEEIVANGEWGTLLKTVVGRAVSVLDERERFIVEKRLMADVEDELSLAEIGRRLGVSRERARQLEARARRKLEREMAALSPSLESAGTGLPSAA